MTLCLARGGLRAIYTPDHQNRRLKRKGGKPARVFTPIEENKARNTKPDLIG